ncbi:MAG: alpha-D-ribose 1-methylphosphonate 5-triphosphate diphosphatase [Alphaproteobacteria bacterium]
MTFARRWTIAGGRVLGADGSLADRDLIVEGDRLADDGAPDGPILDARGALVLPGIVDLHGDAFERQMMPRPGVAFAVDLALLDSDRQLVANGVTTAFHAITCSWEPGLRSFGNAEALVRAIAVLRPRLACDTRVHIRHEAFNLDAVDALLDWIAAGSVDLVAFNDHTPAMARNLGQPARLARIAERAGMPADAFARLLSDVHGRADEVEAATHRIAAAAVARGIPLASHDDRTPAMRDAFAALGARLCEFPLSRETAIRAREQGGVVLMGAPNVVRGGSHLNLISAQSMVAEGLCTVLTSDYYYPALAQAPFRLVREGVMALPEAWRLVSANPAAAAGLADRGTLTPGSRADVVLIDEMTGGLPRVVATVAAGRLVYAEGRLGAAGGFAAAA